MRKWLLGCGVVLALLFVIAEVYLAMDPVTGPAKVAELYQTAAARLHQRDALAQRADTNGFQDLKAVLEDPDPRPPLTSHPAAPYMAMAKWTYSYAYRHEDDLLTLYPKIESYEDAATWRPPGCRIDAILADVSAFETVLPKLENALSKPDFIWPSDWDKGTTFWSECPMDGVPYHMVTSLDGYAEYCEVKHQAANALRYYVLGMELGNKWLLSCSWCVRMTRPATRGINDTLQFLSRGPALQAEDYRFALQRLSQLSLSPRTMLARWDEQYALDMNRLDFVQRDPGGVKVGPYFTDPVLQEKIKNWSWDESGNRFRDTAFLLYLHRGKILVRFPGFIAHEKRTVTNAYLRIRPNLETFSAPAKRTYFMEDMELYPYYLPDFSFGYALTRCRILLTKMNALQVVCALHLYKAERNRWPESLNELVPTYLDKLPAAYASADGTFHYETTGDEMSLSVDLAPDAAVALDKPQWHAYPADRTPWNDP